MGQVPGAKRGLIRHGGREIIVGLLPQMHRSPLIGGRADQGVPEHHAVPGDRYQARCLGGFPDFEV